MSTKKTSKTTNTDKKLSSVDKATKDLYESKAGSVILQIEEMMSTGEFRLRWDAHPCNFISKRRYSGLNLIMIAFANMANENCSSKYWLTFNQAKKLNYNVQKGEKSTTVVAWIRSKYQVEETDDKGEKQTISKSGRLYPKSHSIFNLKQTDAPVDVVPPKTASFTETLDKLKTMMQESGVTFSQGGNSASYSAASHRICMPLFEDFIGETQELREMLYLTTLCHELAHSTMKALRPAYYHKRVTPNPFEPVSIADRGKEEVVAELTAAMLCATLNVEKQVLPDHAGYIRGWLEAAKSESPLYFTTACRLASEAHDLLMSYIDPSFATSSSPEEADQDEVAA